MPAFERYLNIYVHLNILETKPNEKRKFVGRAGKMSEIRIRIEHCTMFVRRFRLSDVQTFNTLKIFVQMFSKLNESGITRSWWTEGRGAAGAKMRALAVREGSNFNRRLSVCRRDNVIVIHSRHRRMRKCARCCACALVGTAAEPSRPR